jgi:hypothetical protein
MRDAADVDGAADARREMPPYDLQAEVRSRVHFGRAARFECPDAVVGDLPAVTTHVTLSGGLQALYAVTVDALTRLSDQTLYVVWARAVLGASWREIAVDVGTTAAGAKRRFQRAQSRVRRDVISRAIRDKLVILPIIGAYGRPGAKASLDPGIRKWEGRRGESERGPMGEGYLSRPREQGRTLSR